jgi:hypothetical protein
LEIVFLASLSKNKNIRTIYTMEACEAHWQAMFLAIEANDRKLAKQNYFLYHDGITELEKTLGPIARHELTIEQMLFIFPPPENIVRD